jgi:hypothetical protein
MTLTKKYWCYAILFMAVQIIVIYSMIYRENNYIAYLYKLQKLEQMHAQLDKEFNVLQNDVQKEKDLTVLKKYAEEILHLKQLPLTSFCSLYGNETL